VQSWPHRLQTKVAPRLRECGKYVKATTILKHERSQTRNSLSSNVLVDEKGLSIHL
jgi:hypothetical protein